MGRWVYTTKTGFEWKSWASTWKVENRVFEGARVIEADRAIRLIFDMGTSYSLPNLPVKIQPNTLYKNHFSRPSKNRKIDFSLIWSILGKNPFFNHSAHHIKATKLPPAQIDLFLTKESIWWATLIEVQQKKWFWRKMQIFLKANFGPFSWVCNWEAFRVEFLVLLRQAVLACCLGRIGPITDI